MLVILIYVSDRNVSTTLLNKTKFVVNNKLVCHIGPNRFANVFTSIFDVKSQRKRQEILALNYNDYRIETSATFNFCSVSLSFYVLWQLAVRHARFNYFRDDVIMYVD